MLLPRGELGTKFKVGQGSQLCSRQFQKRLLTQLGTRRQVQQTYQVSERIACRRRHFSVVCSQNGSSDSPSLPKEDIDEKVEAQGPTVPRQIPDELQPLHEALTRARETVFAIQKQRAELENKAQIVAQITLDRRQSVKRYTRQVAECEASIEEAERSREDLEQQLQTARQQEDTLRQYLASLPSSSLSLDSRPQPPSDVIQQPQDTTALDLLTAAASSLPPESAGKDSSAKGEKGTEQIEQKEQSKGDSTPVEKADASKEVGKDELSEEESQERLVRAQELADELAQGGESDEQVEPAQVHKALALIIEYQNSVLSPALQTVVAELGATKVQCEALRSSAESAQLLEQEAETLTSRCMQRCEEMIKDEMEATAVMNQTQKAYIQAAEELAGLLGPGESDESVQSAQQQISKASGEAMGVSKEVGGGDDTSGSRPSSGDAKDKKDIDEGEVTGGRQKTRAAERQATIQVGRPTPKSTTPERTGTPRVLSKANLPSEVLMAIDPKQKRFKLREAVVQFVAKHKNTIAAVAGVVALVVVALCQPSVRLILKNMFAQASQSVQAFDLPGEHGLIESLWLLFASVLLVPVLLKVPGGNAILGFLLAGAVVGPNALNVVSDIHAVRHLAELGVVFLLFSIGLELSLERLQQLGKYVFGMGAAQFILTTAVVAGCAVWWGNFTGPQGVIIGGGLALSSTAVAMPVMQERNEAGSKYGRGTFSVLLFQDLAVVALLILIPLLGGSETGETLGLGHIAKALGKAGVNALLCITAMIAFGKVVLAPVYRAIQSLKNSDIFAALTLLVVLAAAVTTQACGLSQALGAFLAGLLIAETEYVLQVESDIKPYKGLLMGLFFMSVGMEISVPQLLAQWRTVLVAMSVLLVGKTAVMAAVGRMFGLSTLQAVRAGLLLSSGGEFAFVAYGDAVARGVLPASFTSYMYPVVVLSMALTPYLAELGALLSKQFGKGDIKTLQPGEQTKELKNHVIIAGFGRVGNLVSQLLSEHYIPFVALDASQQAVQLGKRADLPVYFGDAGSPNVLHSVQAQKAKCVVIALNTPSANYRCCWAFKKHFPNVEILVRAHDQQTGKNLMKLGAMVVVPETLEPSLQLGAVLLGKMGIPRQEVQSVVEVFRQNHLDEFEELARISQSVTGYESGRKGPSLSDEDGDSVDVDVDGDDVTRVDGVDGVVAGDKGGKGEGPELLPAGAA